MDEVLLLEEVARALSTPLANITDEMLFSESGDGTDQEIEINTLEGAMTAKPRDWIIRGIQGEFYPCKPDIFEATYEPA